MFIPGPREVQRTSTTAGRLESTARGKLRDVPTRCALSRTPESSVGSSPSGLGLDEAVSPALRRGEGESVEAGPPPRRAGVLGSSCQENWVERPCSRFR